MVSKKERNHYDLIKIENYFRTTLSKRLAGKQQIVDELQSESPFKMDNHITESGIVIADKDRQVDIIHDIHEGSGDTSHSKAMSAYLGRTPTQEKMGFTTMLRTTYKNVIVVKDKVVCHLT